GSVFGGGVYSSGDNMLVSGSNFTNNSVEYTGEYTMYGGAIYNVGSNNKIMNSNFNNNSAFYGGAIYNNDDNLSINGSNFNNNYVSGSGGAIHNNNTYNLSISGSNFNNNSAKSFGGAIENFNASNLNIMSSNFNNNSAKTFYGGAIENDDGINISISGSNFTNNYANRGGGAIYTPHGVNISISGSIFTNNSVDDSGGAIYNDGSDNFSVSGSIFNNNYAKNFGGAILNYDSSNFTVTVTGSSFNNNSATYGGAIVVELSFNFSIMNSNFMSNIANIGSAIYITYKSIFLNNNITNNITIISNNFVNNTNTTIFASNVADILINHNRIYDMDKNHIAVNMTNDTIMGDVNWDLNYNWWGNNTPDTNYNLLNNYFVVNVIKNNLTNYLYTIRLNGSDEDYGFENKLPCFNGSLYLDYSNGSALVFDSKFNANNSHPLNINPAQIAIFTVDDWKSEFNNKITNITINNVSGAKYSTIVTLNASINAFDGNNTGIEIIFYINGEIIGSNTTNNLGNAYYHYKIPFAGNFTYMVSNNDSNHFPTNSSKIYGEFIKSNTNITINSNLNGSKYNNDIVLNATLLDEFGNPLSGVSVDFYINNVFIDSNITDSKGIAIYNYLVDFVGDYNLTSVFNGNDNYTGDIVSVFGDFVKADSNIIINSNINGSKYGDRVVFNATLLDEYGNPLSGVSVDFYINGVFVGSNVTDSNGIAIYNYVVGFVGNYNFTTVFNGNDNYNGDIVSVFGEFAKANSNIIINSNINGSKYNDRVVLNATLLDEYGNPLNNVSVDFYINGEFIDYGTTNTNGIAIINYTVSFVGDYNLTVIFDGNINGYYTYNVDSDSGFGEFIKAHGIINIDNIPKTVDINSKTTIKGNLTDKEGNLLNGKTNLKINVTIGKKSYIHNVEVIDGLWSLKISNPNIGTSNVKITLNDPNYEGNKEFNYTVSKIKTIITVYSPKITAAKKTNIVITLKDKYGKILKGKKLIIKSKYLKKPFKSTTNSKGQINIRIYASAIGKYTGTVEFTGDNIYTKSKKTITQIVTGLPDLTFTKIKRIKSSNYQLATYTVTIKNIGKGDSPKTQLYMQHWKYNGWKSKIIKVNIKAIKAGKSLTLTVKFLPDRGSHRTCKYQWFYINPLKNFKEISYKNNLKCLRP
ncbi:MAG: hypothetical protein LBM96_01920, partial [Methanobrevibacter sp.]|nr:hypothetical protein [Candidatus Methanoflexus mossambicus]